MTRTEKFIFAVLCIIVIFMAGVVTRSLQTRWRQPLGPALPKAPTTPLGLPPTWTPTIPADDAPLSTPQPDSLPTPTETETPTGCGDQPPMFILMIGSDTRENSYLYGLADVIRIMRIDFKKPQVTVLEFPRDLWVKIPDISDNLHGQDHEKLNQAYLYGNSGFGYTKDPAGGPGLLTRTLTLNFGTQIDQYIAINMSTFTKIVDAVGGIDVTLPETVDGRTAEDQASRLVFYEGTHHLNGVQSLTLARIRIEGVFSRAENQNRVLCALKNKLTNPEVIADIPELIQAFQGAVQTSLSPEQLGQLACIGTKIESRNIILASFPQHLFTQSRIYDPLFKKKVFVWDVDYNILRDYIEQFNNGEWPNPITAISSAQDPNNQQEETFFCE